MRVAEEKEGGSGGRDGEGRRREKELGGEEGIMAARDAGDAVLTLCCCVCRAFSFFSKKIQFFSPTHTACACFCRVKKRFKKERKKEGDDGRDAASENFNRTIATIKINK